VVRRSALVIVVAIGLALTGMAPATAAFTVLVTGTTATITGTGGQDVLVLGKQANNLTHDGSADWDAVTPGEQTLADDPATSMTINAGDGVDVVVVGSPGDVFASTITVHGEGGVDFITLNAGGGGADVVTINGNNLVGAGTGHVIWDDTTDQVNVRTGGGADVVTVAATPTSPQVLVYGEDGDDKLALANGVGLGGNGTYKGGPGTDTLDFSAYTTPVAVDLGQTAKFVALLTAAKAVPPSGNVATADAELEFSDLASNTFGYGVFMDGLTAAQITDAHIHGGAPGTNGGVLLPIGAGATWSDPDLPAGTLPSTEVASTTDADITEPALRGGNTYVDVHSAAGDIRGQLTLHPQDGYGGSATGMLREFTVENVIGGSGNDTFKSSVPGNVFACGAGLDSATTGAGDAVIGCETVNGVSTTPNPPTPTPTTPVGSISQLKPKVSAKGAKVTLDTGATAACPVAATAACTATVSATATVGKKALTLGKGTVPVATGQSATLSIKVSKKALKSWRKAGKLKVTVTVTLTVPGGTPAAVTQTVKLKAPPRT
jgi:CHRD domain-containing protein